MVLVATLACLASAAHAEAGRVEVGPFVGFPLSTKDAGNTELGLNAGVTAGVMSDSWFGVGLDVGYQYWPVSSAYKEAFERATFFLVIDEPTWAFRTIQIAAHARVVAPVSRWCQPWAQLGGGMYFVNYNIELLDDESHLKQGYFAGVGLDLRRGTGMKLGLDVTYH